MGRRAKEEKRRSKHYTELLGLLLVLIAIVGFCEFGPVGGFISNMAIVLVGLYYKAFLLLLAGLSVFMIFNHKAPNFFTSRMIGSYILIMAVLIISHLGFIKDGGSASTVYQNTIGVLKDINISGGGVIGATFAIIFNAFFAEGTFIVVIILSLFGLVMFFNVSIADVFKGIFGKLKIAFQDRKSKENKNYIPSDKRVIISSMDQITNTHDREDEVLEEKVEDKEHIPFNTNDNPAYKLPPITILDVPKKLSNNNQNAVKANIEVLERVFNDFDIEGKIVEVHVGPSVTQYEIELKAGTKVSRILSIDREISLALAAKSVKIQAPIPGKNTVGVEIPNRVNTPVAIREVLDTMPSIYDGSKLAVGLGKDIMGNCSIMEINKTPHLLVAGATGSGKSVCINSIIASILMRARPDEVKLVLIDPKKVELSIYNGVPHLLSPVVTDPRKASIALMKIVSEMESRYDLFSESDSKNIAAYNQMIEEKNKILADNMKIKKLPYIVVIIDELADLMLIAAKEVEDSIMRITQMARAAGIHLIVATQRPSTDVVTGIIKANIPSRISFAVSSNVDSRTILDQGGAEKLLGKGDMLFLPMGENTPIRLQGCFISDDEVKRIVDYTVKQQKAQYDERMMIEDHPTASSKEYDAGEDDPMYNEILEFAVKTGKISASLIQRKYRFGYNRAARIIDLFYDRGIVGPPSGSKPRDVLIKLEENNQEDEGE